MLRRSPRAMRRLAGTQATGAITFPATVVPALWFDGRQAMFSDLAGSTPANVGDPLGRNNEIAALGSNWQAPGTTQRGRRDPYGARFDYFGPGTPGQTLVHTSTPAINLNDTTMVISFMPRDAAQGPSVGLLRANGPQFGILGGSGCALNYNSGGQWAPSVPNYVKGSKTTIAARWTSTGLKLIQISGGVTSTDVLATAVTGGTTVNPFSVADGFGASQGFYGSVSQAMVINRGVSDAELSALATFADSQPVPVAYPTTERLFGIIGDSIARGATGVAAYQAWCWTALSNIRSTYPNCEMVNAAVGGSGVSSAMYTPIIPYYSSARTRNVLIAAGGENDIAAGLGAAYVISNLQARCDEARAAGWRVAVATILDRTGSLGVSQAVYDADRATVNAAIIAGSSHYAALIDYTGIPNLSANGAANNATFFSGDLIHPIAAGHALMEPGCRAAMLALAA